MEHLRKYSYLWLVCDMFRMKDEAEQLKKRKTKHLKNLDATVKLVREARGMAAAKNIIVQFLNTEP